MFGVYLKSSYRVRWRERGGGTGRERGRERRLVTSPHLQSSYRERGGERQQVTSPYLNTSYRSGIESIARAIGSISHNLIHFPQLNAPLLTFGIMMLLIRGLRVEFLMLGVYLKSSYRSAIESIARAIGATRGSSTTACIRRLGFTIRRIQKLSSSQLY